MTCKVTKALLDDARLAARGGLARVISDARLVILGQKVALTCQPEIPATAERQI
jgi:hypothetical protein